MAAVQYNKSCTYRSSTSVNVPDSSFWMTGMKPNMVFCWCSSSTSMFGILCVLRHFSADYGCGYLWILLWPISSARRLHLQKCCSLDPYTIAPFWANSRDSYSKLLNSKHFLENTKQPYQGHWDNIFSLFWYLMRTIAEPHDLYLQVFMHCVDDSIFSWIKRSKGVPIKVDSKCFNNYLNITSYDFLSF